MREVSTKIAASGPSGFGVGAAILVGSALFLLLARQSTAATSAFDSAADPAYDLQPGNFSGWLQGSNGGFGWGPWMSVLPAVSGIDPIGFVGFSTNINTPRNASGRAWGLSAPAATDQDLQNARFPGAAVTRKFQGQLTVGQTFSVDFENGIFANPLLSDGHHYPGQAQWDLVGGIDLEFFARADLPDYLFDGMDTGVPLTTEGVHCEFTFLGQNPPLAPPIPWVLKVTPLSPGGQTHVLTGFWTTDVRLLPNEFEFGVDIAGTAVYINNLSVPEPAAVEVVGLVAMLLLRRQRAG